MICLTSARGRLLNVSIAINTAHIVHIVHIVYSLFLFLLPFLFIVYFFSFFDATILVNGPLNFLAVVFKKQEISQQVVTRMRDLASKFSKNFPRVIPFSILMENLYVFKGYGANRLSKEFLNKG